MERIPVHSSNIASIGYEDGLLEVVFRDGKLYGYSGVPPELYGRLMAAPSKGAFLATMIRDKYTSAPKPALIQQPILVPAKLEVFPDDPCCAKHFRKAKLADTVTNWTCPRCGAEWERVTVGVILQWKPVTLIQVW